jgi:hypothetical protein
MVFQVFTGFHVSAPFNFYILINERRKGYIAAFTQGTVVMFDKLGC